MRATPVIAAGTRHIVGVALQALLVAAIVGLAALAMSAVYRPAGFLAGVDTADAASRKTAITVPDGYFGGTTTATANPGGDTWIHVACFRGGDRVLAAWDQVDSANHATFQLGPTPTWSSGAADCTAEEGYWANARWHVLARTTFDVLP